MFGGKRPNYMKMRTNLRLCINRLKLLEKKKTELALKARVEIAEYLKQAKDDRARIRVEHIVREDYLVEAMEIIEMFCDLLIARFGLIEKMKDMDPGLEEPIATIIWAAPRLFSDIPELREVSNQLTLKYGKEFAEACRTNVLEKANEQVLHKMALTAPPKKLIENYLIEIAKTYDVQFEPDPTAMEDPTPTSNLIDIGFESIDPPWKGDDKKGGPPGGKGGGGGGGGGTLQPLSPEHLHPHPLNPNSFGPQFGPTGAAGSMQPPPAGFHQQPQPFYPAGVPPPGAAQPFFPAGVPPPAAAYSVPPLPSRGPVGGGDLPGANSSAYGEKSEPPPDGFNHGASVPVFPETNGINHRPPVRPPQYDDVFGPPPPGAAPDTQPSGAGGQDLRSGYNPNPGFGAAGTAPPVGGVGVLPTLPPGGGFGDIPGLPSVPTGELPTLPSVPGNSVSSNAPADDINFDDLTKRFEELKRKK